jgi:3-dehydroquinate dehydratase/shikimate dehydrogenase
MPFGKLCVSLVEETLDDVFASDVAGADCIEVRLDHLQDPFQALNARWDRFAVPVIATCRGVERGGRFRGSLDDEFRILEGAARNGARWVDIDYRFARPVAGADVIASYHNFDETPASLADIAARTLAGPGQIGKVATQVNRWDDNRRLLTLLAAPHAKPLIVAGMGDLGQITRIAGPSRGSFLTFAAAAKQAAPGQITVRDMLDAYTFRRIQPSTRLLGILGNPVAHSMSPPLHNRAFAAAGLDFAYLKLPAPDLGDFMQNARAVGLSGFSVTIPHKITVMPYMARLSDAARWVGAVNTVWDDNGAWVGDNTDVHGVEAALKAIGFDARGKKVIILGRGGGAKAAIAAVAGAREVAMLSRTETADAGATACDLLVNATPVGMHPNVEASPVNGPIAASAVFDMVYNPPDTRLLRQARGQGRIAIGGMAMLLAQAARQFEIWTGQPAPQGVYQES